MGIARLTLGQVIKGLQKSLTSLDLRAAVMKSNASWQSVLTCLRISARSVEMVRQRHAQLEKRFGRRPLPSFGVLLEALPFSEVERLLRDLTEGTTTIEGYQVKLSGKLVLDGFETVPKRSDHHVLPWDDEQWPRFYYSFGSPSIGYHHTDLNVMLRSRLGLTVPEAVDAFLETKGSSQYGIDLCVHVEVPARISITKLIDRSVHLQVKAHKNLQALRSFLSRKQRGNSRLLEHHQLDLQVVRDEPPFVIYGAHATLESAPQEDILTSILASEDLPELDEVTEAIRQLMPPVERNPLLECLQQFWYMERFYDQLERPYAIRPTKVRFGPQHVFQKTVTQLLSLAGFEAIDLERQDVLRDPRSAVQRATIDVLAYHQHRKVLLLGACTISSARTEDIEKLLQARQVISASFPAGSRVKLVPVLFCGEAGTSSVEEHAMGEGMRILNARNLRALRTLIENGMEDRFVWFLESPFPVDLSDRLQ